MRKFFLNKLVRDKVFANMVAEGQKVGHRRLNDKDFLKELKRKLLEEAEEFEPDHPEALDELADLLEVVETLGETHGSDFEKLRDRQLKRRDKRGSFNDRIYVESVELDDNDPWVKYYEKQSGRFKEI